MKLNNKGFAVSIILYSMIAVITIVLLLIVSIYATNVHNKLTQADRVKEKISNLQTLTNKILGDNNIITTATTLTNSSNNTSDRAGLYKSIVTTSGQPTYYFRGNVNNNYVSFAGLTWRIVRINEDETIRLVLDDFIPTNSVYYNKTSDYKLGMYYTNTSDANQVKYILENWYDTTLKNKYSSKIMKGKYFCQQNKVISTTSINANNAAQPKVYNNYIADFRCGYDGNNYGVVEGLVGMLTYDEVVLAGGYYNKTNKDYYLYKAGNWWTMSPSDYNSIWYVNTNGAINQTTESTQNRIRPVINIRSNVTATGTGISSDKYIIN